MRLHRQALVEATKAVALYKMADNYLKVGQSLGTFIV